MAALGHPVAGNFFSIPFLLDKGDKLYHRKASKQETEGLCLVAKKLSFEHPLANAVGVTHPKLELEVEYPDTFRRFLEHLEKEGRKVVNEYEEDF